MQILASIGLLLTVMGLSGGAWYFWERVGDAVIPAGRYLVFIGALVAIFSVLANWLTGKGLIKRSLFAEPRAWTLGLVAIFFSDWMNRPWGLFKGPAIRGEIFVMLCGAYLLYRKGSVRWLLGLPILSAALLLWSFFLAADGRLLFSDDHAMFLFRLKLLRENFPSIPFWSPVWNAGFDARDFFATGALNAFLLSIPLIYTLPVETAYPVIISILIWILPMLCVGIACRLLGFSWVASGITSTLSISSSLFWYRWGLKYGTIGFITSASLFPLVIALLIRFVHRINPRVSECCALALSSTLMLLWSPSGIAALPVGLCALPYLPRLIRSRRHVITILLIIALNVPWMTMMWKVSKVGKFLGSDRPKITTQQLPSTTDATKLPANLKNDERTFRHEAGAASSKKTLTQWHNYATSLNPLVLICAAPALLALPLPLFSFFALTVLWLTILGTVGVSLKPQLELDRMLLLSASLLIIPIGTYLEQVFMRARETKVWGITASVLSAFLLVGPCAAASVVLNRADDHYFFATDDVEKMSQVIRSNSNTGRVVFTGCVLHELSGGHIAPLPLWSDTPMIASSYAHNIWKYEQPIPQALLDKGDTGITEYFNLMNATLVAAHEPTWIDYFRHRPEQYVQIWRGDRFFLFKRLQYTPSYSIDGEITNLTHTTNSISLTPLSDSVTLKFKFFPFLQSSGCSLQSVPSGAGSEFIRLTGCTPGTSIKISSVSPLTRLTTPNL